ncbi:hypothetical protein C8R44DRAFT_987998 [Mycena epipterygia]|nr:hypothetical protein C8R44DRAFT_987998 [Mycena epipterygia]
MDSETQPFLDTEVGPVYVHDHSQPHHLCARCSSDLASQDYKGSKSLTLRHILISVAIALSCMMFILSVAEMGSAWRFKAPSIVQLFVALWTDVTITFLALLLYAGRRGDSRPTMGRTTVQIHVLTALACSWIIFMVAMLTQNSGACAWRSGPAACGLFTTVHVLSWFLIFVLFTAAYATYRRAVTIHGTTMVPLPVTPTLVPAWRVSHIAGGEGSVKI